MLFAKVDEEDGGAEDVILEEEDEEKENGREDQTGDGDRTPETSMSILLSLSFLFIQLFLRQMYVNVYLESFLVSIPVGPNPSTSSSADRREKYRFCGRSKTEFRYLYLEVLDT